MHTLIPNASILSKHLSTFSKACGATEVILFERTTFLVIATSRSAGASPSSSASDLEDLGEGTRLDPKRYERTSELIKGFKHSCLRVREEFRSLEMELYDFTAVLDEMTRNTYVMIIVHDPTIGMQNNLDTRCPMEWLTLYLETAALKLNIKMARKKFEELQSDSLITP